ncbi:unnamed protein product [Amoebophrya sp. A120]|nr:unnamed protein product [Amoebophrya sp. A120]|eukprot:GSA120T00017505001.1
MQPGPKRVVRNPLTSVGNDAVQATTRPAAANPLFAAPDPLGAVPPNPLAGGGGGSASSTRPAPSPLARAQQQPNPLAPQQQQQQVANAAMQQEAQRRQQLMAQQQEQQRRQQQMQQEQQQRQHQEELQRRQQQEQYQRQQLLEQQQKLQRQQEELQQQRLEPPPRTTTTGGPGGRSSANDSPLASPPPQRSPQPQDHSTQQLKPQPPPPNIPPMQEGGRGARGTTAGSVDRVRALVNSVISASIVRAETKSGLLQSHTTYVIKVNDFGREYEVERRFTDFETLHSDLSRICGTDALPRMPERGWGTSTDPNTVEERKPKLNVLLQACLANKEALFEKSNILWNFLDLTLPSIFCTRAILHGFNFCSNNLIGDLRSSVDQHTTSNSTQGEGDGQRSSKEATPHQPRGTTSTSADNASTRNIKVVSKDLVFFFAQLHKLAADAKYETERYRLEHATMFKIVLGLLEEVEPGEQGSVAAEPDRPPVSPKPAAEDLGGEQQFVRAERGEGGGAGAGSGGAAGSSSFFSSGGATSSTGAAGASTSTGTTSKHGSDQVIAACAEILGHTLRKSEASRTLFLKDKGIEKLFRVIRKEKILNLRVKRVFSSLLSCVGGDTLGEALASALVSDPAADAKPGARTKPKLLEVLTDLADSSRDASFHDFLSKMLWFVWDCESVQNFFVDQGLFLLSRLFVVNSVITRLYTALMFGVMLTNHLLDERKRTRVEEGLCQLMHELEPLAFMGQLRAAQQSAGDVDPHEQALANGASANGLANGDHSQATMITGLLNKYVPGAAAGDADGRRDSTSTEASGVVVGNSAASSSTMDPGLRAFHSELMQIGNLQSSLIKIHSCLADTGNVVAAKLALYVLREARLRPEYLCRFFPALRPWVVHEIAGHPEAQCVAADILLEMTLQPASHYADKAVGGGEGAGEESMIPWYFQDGELETALHKALMRKVEFESGMLRQHLEQAAQMMNAQLEFSAQRMLIQPPRSLVLHFEKSRQATSPHLGGEQSFFAPLEQQMADYERSRAHLKAASEAAVRAKGGVTSTTEQVSGGKLAKMVPKLPLGMTESMQQLGKMCESSQSQFFEASQRSEELARLEAAAKTADEEVKEAEMQVGKLQGERSTQQMQLQEKKLQLSKLQHQLWEAKMQGGNQGEIEGHAANLQKEIASLEERDAAGEGARVSAEGQARAATEKRAQLLEQLLHQREACRTGNVTQLRDSLLQQKNKLVGPFRKFHREWEAVSQELLRAHATQAQFHQKLRDLARALQGEQRERAALGTALARTRDELSHFEQALLVNDHGLEEVTTSLLY